MIFDYELRWKEHVQQAVKRATKVNIALGELRQLYEACVAPVVEYASTVWHDPLRDKTHLRHLRTVQRTALIRVLSAFRTLATNTLDVEAHVLPTWAQRRRNNRGSIARFRLSEALNNEPGETTGNRNDRDRTRQGDRDRKSRGCVVNPGYRAVLGCLGTTRSFGRRRRRTRRIAGINRQHTNPGRTHGSMIRTRRRADWAHVLHQHHQ